MLEIAEGVKIVPSGIRAIRWLSQRWRLEGQAFVDLNQHGADPIQF